MFKVKREPALNGEVGGEGKGFPPGPERRAALLAPTSETGDVLQRNLELFNIRTRRVDAAEEVGEVHFVVVDVDDVAGMRERVDELKKWGKAHKVCPLPSGLRNATDLSWVDYLPRRINGSITSHGDTLTDARVDCDEADQGSGVVRGDAAVGGDEEERCEAGWG